MSAPPPTSDSVVTVARAVRALPLRDADARVWLVERGLIVDLAGRPRVIWGRVLAELARTAPERTAAHRRRRVHRVPETGDRGDDKVGTRWPRKLTIGDVQAAPMKGRGRREDGRVYWRVRRTVGGHQVALSITAYTPSRSGWATRHEAQLAILDALHGEHSLANLPPGQAGTRVSPDVDLTVKELLGMYIEQREAMGGLAPATLGVYRGVARRLGKTFSGVRVVDVSTALLENHARRRLAGGVGAGSVNLEFAVLGPALRWAIETGRVYGLEMPKVPHLSYKPKKTSKPPPMRALRKAFDALETANRPVFLLLRLQALLGARGGEIHNLRWSDVVTAGGTTMVRLDGKTGEREVPASPAAVEVLDELRRAGHGIGSGAKVIGDLGDRSISAYRRYIYRAIDALDWSSWGEESFRPHQLRALFSDRLIKSGVSLPVFQALTGHTPAIAAKHYWEARPDEKRAAVLKADIATDLDVSPVAFDSSRARRPRD